jgi:type II secretory pathway pseudopilin PulG
MLPHRPLPLNVRDRRGFLLVEHLVAAGMIVVFAMSALVALVQANRFATASRLQAIALAMAQQRVDEVLTTPWNASSGRPAVLAPGTRTEANLPLNNDSLASSSAGTLSSFSNLDVQVNATRVTQITDVTARQLRANVSVTYRFGRRNYTLSLTTLRAVDSI